MSELKVWELLVPAHQVDGNVYPIEHHQVWDRWICELIGGLTLSPVVKGRWGMSRSELVAEKMIPVKLACTDEQLQRVLEFTGQHYQQEEIMAWVVSDEVRVWKR